MLRSTSSVIGGSTALAFINSTSFIPGDLDLYTTNATSSILIEHLRNHEAYTISEVVEVPNVSSNDRAHYLAGIRRITVLRDGQ